MADTTEKTAADELREAAALLRKAGSVASMPPWRRDGMAVATGSGVAALAYNGVDAAWIEVASPALAEPLASWLEEYARWAKDSILVEDEESDPPVHESDYCDGEIGKGCQCFAHPLAVARVLNGSRS